MQFDKEKTVNEFSQVIENPFSITIYAIIQLENDISIKILDIDNGSTNEELKKMYKNSIETIITKNTHLEFSSITSLNEQKHTIYLYDENVSLAKLDKINRFINSPEKDKNNQDFLSLKNGELNSISAYLIGIGTQEKTIWLYKKQYPVSLIKSTSFLLYESKQRLERIKKDIIRLSDDFQVIFFTNKCFVLNLKVFETDFDYREVITENAKKVLNKIKDLDIIESIESLEDEFDNDQFVRKMSKLSTNSPVFSKSSKISAGQLLEFIEKKESIKQKFKFSENKKIILDTKKSKNEFLKLLDDDYLTSELTGAEYTVHHKEKNK